MILKEILEKSTQFLKSSGFETPRLDCELLFSHALSMSRMELYLKFDKSLSEEEKESCRALLKRRKSGEPVSYILNKKEFFGLDFYVNNCVLIPRPETELMIEDFIENHTDNKSFDMYDFGCGSGCIGLSVLNHFKDSKLTGFDISEGAVEVSLKNSKNLELSDRSKFINQSVSEINSEAKVDVIFANPPYIDEKDIHVCENVRKFEPYEALFSKEKGLFHINEWIKKSAECLKPSGELYLEFGSTQAVDTLDVVNKLEEFENIKIIKDYQKFDRILYCTKK